MVMLEEERERLLEALKDLPEFLSIRQMIDLLGLSRSTLYRWIKIYYTLPAVKIRGKWLIPKRELERIILEESSVNDLE